MNKDDKPPDVVDWGYDEHQPTSKEMAKIIYDQLIDDNELMYELNVLLRKNKIREISNECK